MGGGHSRRAERPIGTTSSAADLQDAELLRATVREAVRISPGSFLTTLDEVEDAELLDYWLDKLRSATWVVAECDGTVVGVVAAKPPNANLDEEDRETARYIESLWIAPDFRRRGLGQRIIQYLLAAEYRRNRKIKQFLLWVFATNKDAIEFYKHIGFEETRESNEGSAATTEIKYRLDFDVAVHAAVVETRSAADDRRQHRVTYRVLG
jgi:ribosomal protein S18 acetylase RimI-like enzyme